MIRATYRTRDNKIQTTIKNIRLREGGSINKLVAFHDGTLKVVAKREGEGLYVKVEAYRAGTRDRVAFGFSNRVTGVAKLTLNEGVYDIEVHEHNNVKRFDNITIKSGKTNSLDAVF
jgi:hypothetical protein